MRRMLAAVLLVVAACGSTVSPAILNQASSQTQGGLAATPQTPGTQTTGTQATGGTPSANEGTAPSSTALPGEQATAPGATPILGSTPSALPVDAAPIQVGFLDTEVSNASAFGANAGQTISGTALAQGLVDAFNKTGGIDGRRITAVIARTDTGTASWETDFAAACAKFTQDNHVAAVLGYTFVFLDSFESCLNKAGVLHLDDGYSTGDAVDQQLYPLHFSLSNPTYDRHYLAQLEGGVQTGYINKANRLGVLITSCPADQRAWQAAGLPYAKAHGLDIAAVETFDCVSGANDDSAAVGELTGAVLKFRSAGVDRVFGEGPPILLFGVAAEAQGWHPGYVVTSWTGGSAIEGSGLMPADQEANVHGFGWFPIADVDLQHQPPLNAPQQRCLALYKGEGLVPKEYNDFITMYTDCDAMFLYEAALKRTDGQSDSALVAQTIDAMGTSYVSPSTLDGLTTFGPQQHDAPTVAAPWGWTASCKCFTYQGPARPIG